MGLRDHLEKRSGGDPEKFKRLWNRAIVGRIMLLLGAILAFIIVTLLMGNPPSDPTAYGLFMYHKFGAWFVSTIFISVGSSKVTNYILEMMYGENARGDRRQIEKIIEDQNNVPEQRKKFLAQQRAQSATNLFRKWFALGLVFFCAPMFLIATYVFEVSQKIALSTSFIITLAIANAACRIEFAKEFGEKEEKSKNIIERHPRIFFSLAAFILYLSDPHKNIAWALFNCGIVIAYIISGIIADVVIERKFSKRKEINENKGARESKGSE